MKIELIAIGDEVLYGYTVNTNGSFIAKELLELGFCPTSHMTIGDDPSQMQEALELALKRSDIVITTGGLGPTCDDHTKEVVSNIFTSQEATLFNNNLGSAWGFAVEKGASLLIALPGVPLEMKAMFSQVKEYLKQKFTNRSMPWSCVFHFLDTKELEIDPLLRDIEKKYPTVCCGIYPALGQVSVRFTTQASSQEEASALFQKPQELLLAQFGKKRFESDSGRLDEAVHDKLLLTNETIATAESCTAGALAASLTAYPDSSKYFLGGIVSYANEVKKELLHVGPKVLEEKGAVSIEVVTQMAENARSLFRSDIAIGVSGILGPSGGTPEKPVGTVCAAIARKTKPTFAWIMHLHGNRATLREQTIQQILAKLYYGISG